MILIDDKFYNVYEVQYTDKFNNISSFKYMNSILSPSNCTLHIVKGDCSYGKRVAKILLVSDKKFDGDFILKQTINSRPVCIKLPYHRIYPHTIYDIINNITLCGTSIDLCDKGPEDFERLKIAIKKYCMKGLR